MTSFSAVVDFQVKFLAHMADPKAHTHLNNLYGFPIPHPERLFVDPDTMTTVKEDVELLKDLRKILVEEMIAPFAVHTPDVNHIALVIANAALFVINEASNLRRLGKGSLTQALQHAITNNRTQVEIRISMNHIVLDNSGPTYFTDWQTFATTRLPPKPTAPADTLSANDIASAVASALPPPPPALTATDLANAFASAFNTSARPASGPTTTGTASSTTTRSSMYTFNPASFPADVRLRYENKLKKGLILGSSTRTPYSTGYMYHAHGTDKLVLSDGTLFIMQEPNEKEMLKAQIYCDNNTHAGIRSWYSNLVQVLHDYGFYAHPLWAFRPNHGGTTGFTIGNDVDDDLPQRMEIAITRMSAPIFRLLSKKEMFPRDSRLASIVRSCDGDGYRALKAVIFSSHPAFFDQPSTLITAYPRQRELTTLAYYQVFVDYQQLRAFIADTNLTLDNPSELDIFIKNLRYSSFINRITRDERRLKTLAYKYRGTQIVETIEKFLQAPDSPMHSAVSKNSKPFHNKPFNNKPKTNKPFRKPPQATMVNQLDIEGAKDTPIDDDPAPTLDTLEIPADDQDRELYHIYCASVLKIGANPADATASKCIVCGDTHRFDKCPILQNTAFLKQHYIRFCQQLRREAAARNKTFPGNDQPPAPKTATVNFIDTQDSDDDESDFQTGRV